MSLAIPATVATVVGLTEADYVLHGKPPTMKPVIGGFVLGLALFGLSTLDSRLAVLFGVLFVVTALVEHGVSVFNALGGNTK